MAWSEYPVPKCVRGQELQDFEGFPRAEDDISRVLAFKLGASPGMGPPGIRNEWQRSLKEAPKLLWGEEVPTARAVPRTVGCFLRGRWRAEVGGRGKTTSRHVVY